MQEQDGRPVTFDLGRPIRYVVRPNGSRGESKALVGEALRRVASVSRFVFEFVGFVDGQAPDRHSVLAGLHEPVWFGWVDPGETDLLPAGAIGVGCQTTAFDGSGRHWVGSGAVVLASDAGLRLGFGAGINTGNALLHEVGHLLGLGHVDDATQIMYPTLSPSSPDGLHSGDIAGLRALSGAVRQRRVGKLVVTGLRTEEGRRALRYSSTLP